MTVFIFPLQKGDEKWHPVTNVPGTAAQTELPDLDSAAAEKKLKFAGHPNISGRNPASAERTVREPFSSAAAISAVFFVRIIKSAES